MPTVTEYTHARQLRTERAECFDKLSEISQKAFDENKRSLTSEEMQEFDKLKMAIDDLTQRIDTLETSWNSRKDYDTKDDTESNDRSKKNNKRTLRPIPGETDIYREHRNRRSSREYGQEFAGFLSTGQVPARNARSVIYSDDVQGGFMVLPEQMLNRIIKNVDDMFPMFRRVSSHTLLTNQKFTVPTLTNDLDDADWTTEISPISEDDKMRFGKLVLTPTPARKRVLVSEMLLNMDLQLQFFNDADEDGENFSGGADSLVENRITYAAGRTREKAMTVGTGNGQPLGLFTPSSRGIGIDRNVTSGSNNTFTYRGLLRAKYNVKAQYHSRASWLMHRLAMLEIMGLVDSANRPLLNFNTLPNQPTLLLESPIDLSEFAPSTFTVGQPFAMYGDASTYHYVQVRDYRIKRADQLYLEQGMIGFFLFMEGDGMPSLPEAYTRIVGGA